MAFLPLVCKHIMYHRQDTMFFPESTVCNSAAEYFHGIVTTWHTSTLILYCIDIWMKEGKRLLNRAWNSDAPLLFNSFKLLLTQHIIQKYSIQRQLFS